MGCSPLASATKTVFFQGAKPKPSTMASCPVPEQTQVTEAFPAVKHTLNLQFI